jgi:hypothetical protein
VEETRSWLSLLKPKWLLLHVFAIAASIAMIWLGHWQWRAAIRHHGEIQNYAYAFQWWAFSIFTWVMWLRVVRDYRRGPEAGEHATIGELDATTADAPADAVPYLRYVAPASVSDADDDPERAQYNAYLAGLYNDAALPNTTALHDQAALRDREK